MNEPIPINPGSFRETGIETALQISFLELTERFRNKEKEHSLMMRNEGWDTDHRMEFRSCLRGLRSLLRNAVKNAKITGGTSNFVVGSAIRQMCPTILEWLRGHAGLTALQTKRLESSNAAYDGKSSDLAEELDGWRGFRFTDNETFGEQNRFNFSISALAYETLGGFSDDLLISRPTLLQLGIVKIFTMSKSERYIEKIEKDLLPALKSFEDWIVTQNRKVDEVMIKLKSRV